MPRPSIVVMRLPTAAETGVTQAGTGLPSRWTVQAPHWAMPQPYLVPVRESRSRSTQSSGMSGSTSNSWTTPLTLNARFMRGCYQHRPHVNHLARPRHSPTGIRFESPKEGQNERTQEPARSRAPALWLARDADRIGGGQGRNYCRSQWLQGGPFHLVPCLGPLRGRHRQEGRNDRL